MIALQSLIIKKSLFIMFCICALICTACSSKSIGTEPFPSGKDEANPDNLFADGEKIDAQKIGYPTLCQRL